MGKTKITPILLLLLLAVRISGLKIFTRVSGKCKATRKDNGLVYNGSDTGLCKWAIQKQEKPRRALVLYIEEVTFPNCTANLSLPGVKESCVRTEPFCHVYTSNDTYCDQSEINSQAKALFSQCTSTRTHISSINMEMLFQSTSSEPHSFIIASEKISCKRASGQNEMTTTGILTPSQSQCREQTQVSLAFTSTNGFETTAAVQTYEETSKMMKTFTSTKPSLSEKTSTIKIEHATVYTAPEEHVTMGSEISNSRSMIGTEAETKTEIVLTSFLIPTEGNQRPNEGLVTNHTGVTWNFSDSSVTTNTTMVELDSIKDGTIGESWIVATVIILSVLAIAGIIAVILLCMSRRRRKYAPGSKRDELPGYRVTKA